MKNKLEELRKQRDSLPIIADGAGVVAVAGFTIDERVKADENTKRVLLFKIKTEENF